jgi:hypothetical protein
VQTDPRWRNALALELRAAWRLHTITMAGRAYPEVPGDGAFAPQAGHTMYPMPSHGRPPQASPALRAMGRGLAQLGGFCARTGDGEPGIQAIWQGDQRLHEGIYALETQRRVDAP